MDDFDAKRWDTGQCGIFARRGGRGPPLLLLHGFPQTHAMWRDVASILADDFTVVCADLRGYGASDAPTSDDRHAAYSKRTLGRDMVGLMAAMGFTRFGVVGHDRGARVASRMAVDHPAAVDALVVLDIVPSEAVWARADARFALGYWPWSLLAQDAPLPERLLQAVPDVVVDAALGGWGTSLNVFPPHVRLAWVDGLREPAHAHAICEEYRAAATIDREHDRADLAAARRITCPVLALWSAAGPLGSWYADAGGPPALWREWADTVEGRGVGGGHFFPEEHPVATADAIRAFIGMR